MSLLSADGDYMGPTRTQLDQNRGRTKPHKGLMVRISRVDIILDFLYVMRTVDIYKADF